MGKRFPFGSEKHGSFTYIGLEVNNLLSGDGHITGIYVSQKEDIDALEVVPVDGKPHDSLDPNEVTLFRSLLGKLMWIAGQTTLDIAYKVCNLSLGLAHPRKKHFTLANSIVKYLRSLHVPLIYRPFVGEWTFIVYSDASFGTAEECASIEGGLMFLGGGGGHGPMNLICWCSRKFRRVVRSTFAGELLEVNDAIDRVVPLDELAKVVMGHALEVRVRTDCKSVYDTVYHHKGATEKRLLIDIAILKNVLSTKEVESPSWVPSHLQYADCLPKDVSSKSLVRVITSGFLACDEDSAVRDGVSIVWHKVTAPPPPPRTHRPGLGWG